MKRSTGRKSFGRTDCPTCKTRQPLDRFNRIQAHKIPGSAARTSRCSGTGVTPKAVQ
jgi:hypothetical protein